MIDEADRMVEKGHYAELESILGRLPSVRKSSSKAEADGKKKKKTRPPLWKKREEGEAPVRSWAPYPTAHPPPPDPPQIMSVKCVEKVCLIHTVWSRALRRAHRCQHRCAVSSFTLSWSLQLHSTRSEFSSGRWF